MLENLLLSFLHTSEALLGNPPNRAYFFDGFAKSEASPPSRTRVLPASALRVAGSKPVNEQTALQKVHMQGVRILRNEAYLQYVGMTKGEAQHRRWTFCEAVRGSAPESAPP